MPRKFVYDILIVLYLFVNYIESSILLALSRNCASLYSINDLAFVGGECPEKFRPTCMTSQKTICASSIPMKINITGFRDVHLLAYIYLIFYFCNMWLPCFYYLIFFKNLLHLICMQTLNFFVRILAVTLSLHIMYIIILYF